MPSDHRALPGILANAAWPAVAHPDGATIRKQVAQLAVSPHLQDWEATCRGFSWEQARSALAGLPGGALNIGHEAVDRHALGARADHVAIRWLGAQGGEQDLSYRDLRERTNRFANVLRSSGLQRGDRLFVLAPRVPDLYVAVLGALKAGLVVSPLYSAFGPEPIATRMNLGGGRALVTTETLVPAQGGAGARADRFARTRAVDR